jgi:hypothetical protein
VAQEYGGEHPEYVSMGRLRTVKANARDVYERHKDHLPEVPRLPLVEAIAVPAKSLFAPQEIIAGCPETITSEPFYLQTESDEAHSFAIDLSGLHEGVIFSVILTNQKWPHDLTGGKAETILVRNGVTATAARKTATGRTVWFYHGKPMNDGDMRLHVTVGRDQMTFAYYEDGRLYVHGDCPVSRLSVDHIGDVKGMPFYVHIYTKDKMKKPAHRQKQKQNVPKVDADVPTNKAARKAERKRRWEAKNAVVESESSNATEKAAPVEEVVFEEDEPNIILKILDIDGKGYIHESIGEDERNDFGFELIQYSETVAGQDADELSAQDQALASNLDKLTLV